MRHLSSTSGIVMADGPAGPRARIEGTGLDVWEVIAVYHDCGDDREALRYHFDWLEPSQVDAALDYYEQHTVEIDAWIECNQALSESELGGRHPELLSK